MSLDVAVPAEQAGLEVIVVESPIGPVGLVGDDRVLRRVLLPNVVGPLDGRPGRGPVRQAARQLEEYFAGRRRGFEVPFWLGGTPFQRAVWSALDGIAYGETVSYAELARRVGRPAAFRAVGQANGANPLPIILPCHRVVAADGSIGGYGGGLPVKRQLLALEGVAV
jgi:methylated-DNA-[protein]-cysteine S-methyltransferase